VISHINILGYSATIIVWDVVYVKMQNCLKVSKFKAFLCQF